MRLKIILLSLLLVSAKVQAQIGYAVSSIPKNLLNRTGAVVRLQETEIKINGLSDVTFKEKRVITILNESAQEHASMVFFYDKVSQIKSIKGLIYNEFGLPVSKIAEKGFQDRSAVDNSTIYADDRVKYFYPTIKTFPYTLEYEIEYKRRQTLILPTWMPVNDYEVAVEKSTLKVIYPVDFKLRHKEYSFEGEIKENVEEKNKMIQWTLNNFSAIRDEPYSPHYEQYLPIVKLAPEKFAYNDIDGSFSNWNDYGKWMSENLLKGRDKLSNETRQAILDLTSNVASPKEKARLVYEYMQNKTRYISVQVGIGGYRPFPAAEVDQLGYGDCKGLVNYTRALLNVAGIESYYSIVYAGSFKQSFDPDFTSLNQGNHIILCLPFKNDTTWLECTSKHQPFGFLGDFTDDRLVLACTPEGGKLLRTPKLNIQDNAQIRIAEFNIAADGSVEGKMTTRFTGSQFDNHDRLFNEPKEEQLKKIPELYPKLSFQPSSLDYKKLKSQKPETVEILNFSSGNYCTLNDQKLHIPLNKINLISKAPKEIRNRQTEVYINRGFYDEDIATYNLPEGYKASGPVQNTVVEKVFGKYTMDVSYLGDKIIYKRTLTMKDGYYKPELYQDLVDFYQEVADLDGSSVTLPKQ
jgi:hypothetical protein